MLLHLTNAVTLRLHLFTTMRIHILVFVCYETVFGLIDKMLQHCMLTQRTDSMK